MAEKVVIGNAELWHGDCRGILPTLPECDLILTDPPYGIAKQMADGIGHKWDHEWDDTTPPDWIFGLMMEKGRCLIVWGGNYYKLPPSRGWLSWFKPDAVPTMAQLEMAWTSMDMNAKQLKHSIAATNAERVGHPTQKPVRVMEWSLSFAEGAKTVCDPFMGSGTTGVACANHEKQFFGIERERKYFDIACERIARAQDQERLFA